jgi:glycosyltransferase involved in cell wall biosynthesis
MSLNENSGERSRPVVSVIMANYNGADYIADAVSSVRKQTLTNFEIIIFDDASSDCSVDIVSGLAANDARLRLLRSDRNLGPAAARNRALDVARGEWIAIVDSDDFIHPTRLETLINFAIRDGADIVADDLIIFESTSRALPPTTLLKRHWTKRPFWIDTASYIKCNTLYSPRPILGYLKPVFRADLVASHSVRYNELLTIGEDYHFVLNLLRTGAKFRVYPQLSYFYRKHNSSISHRLNQQALEALKAADLRLADEWNVSERKIKAALAARIRSFDLALAYDRLLNALKSGNWPNAARAIVDRPMVLPLLRLPIAARFRRLWLHFQPKQAKCNNLQLCILSRQRVTGRTNGSSVYLLDLAKAISDRGFHVHFLSPSPTTLGSWPYMTVSKDLAVFKTIRIRGTWRIGQHFISWDPKRFVRAVLAVCDIVLLKYGVTKRSHFKRAPYSIALPLTREDRLFIARYASPISDYLLADYCFLVDALPYALRPAVETGIIMHDRISSRPGQFEAVQSDTLEAMLTENDECQLLNRADTIVSIQQDEADFVRRHLPTHRVIVAPVAARPVTAPQPGIGTTLLFVGSGAAANIDGIRWFVECCWSSIRKAYPKAELCIAGTVSRYLGVPPAGVRFEGFIENLDPLYRDASVIISPLRIGSGLKIKVIEALSRGKAVVATSKTLQGVKDYLTGAVLIADEAKEFSDAVILLLDDKKMRFDLGSRGLEQVRRHFSADNCYGPLIEHLTRRATPMISSIDKPSSVSLSPDKLLPLS